MPYHEPLIGSDIRVMVTGGAGFIGSHLTDVIASMNPASLVVADSFFLGKPENLVSANESYPDLVVERVDMADPVAARNVIERHRPDVVFDLATIPLPYSLEYPAETISANVDMATNLCEAARVGLISTLIHISTSEVYGTAIDVPMSEDHPLGPLTPYAASKAAADHIVASYWNTFGIDAAIVRPFNNYGPRQNEGAYAGLIPLTLRRLLAGEQPVVHGDGTQTRDFVFARDTAEGIVAAYSEPRTRRTVTNLASGSETSVNEIVSSLISAVGIETAPIHTDPRPGDVDRHFGANARASEILGWSPTTSLEAGMKETVAWYLSELS